MRSNLLVVMCIVGPALASMVGCYRLDPVLMPSRPLRPGDLPAIESATGLNLPDIRVVKHIAVLHGKDTIIFLELELPEKDAATALEAVKSRAEPLDPSRVFSPTPVVPWFVMPPEGVRAAFAEPNWLSMAFCAPRKGHVAVFVISSRGNDALYDIFN